MTAQHVDARGEADNRLSFGLAELISPLNVETFLDDYWEKKHVVLRRRQPHHYDSVLTLDDMDFLLATCKIASQDLRVVAGGKDTPIAELVSPELGNHAQAVEALYDRYRKGATVNLLFVQDVWPPFTALCRSLAQALSAQCHVNIYLTPQGTQALNPHYDTHDVFVAQIFGTKRWRLYQPQVELPLRNQHFAPSPAGLGEPTDEFDLAPGDMFYMPRGTVHEAIATDTGSLHVTVGAQPVVWAEMVRRAVERVAEKDRRFRQGLPPNVNTEDAMEQTTHHVEELLAALREGLSARAIVRDAVDRSKLAVKPDLRGHLVDLESLESMTLDTALRRRPGASWPLQITSGVVVIEWHGKRIQFPERVREELEFVGRADAFTARELPGGLDEPGRMVLVKKLVLEGLLTRVRPD